MRLRISLFFLIFSSLVYSQNDEINCDSLYSKYSGKCWVVEKIPELIIGMDSLWSIINFPEALRTSDSFITIYVMTIVDTSGIPLCTKILRGLTEEYDTKALKTLSVQKFKPAYIRNKPIMMLTVIPIRIKVIPISGESFFYGEWIESKILELEDPNNVIKKHPIIDSTIATGNGITFLQDSTYLYTMGNNVYKGKYWYDVDQRYLYLSRTDQLGFDRFQVFYFKKKLFFRSLSGKMKLLFLGKN